MDYSTPTNDSKPKARTTDDKTINAAIRAFVEAGDAREVSRPADLMPRCLAAIRVIEGWRAALASPTANVETLRNAWNDIDPEALGELADEIGTLGNALRSYADPEAAREEQRQLDESIRARCDEDDARRNEFVERMRTDAEARFKYVSFCFRLDDDRDATGTTRAACEYLTDSEREELINRFRAAVGARRPALRPTAKVARRPKSKKKTA